MEVEIITRQTLRKNGRTQKRNTIHGYPVGKIVFGEDIIEKARWESGDVIVGVKEIDGGKTKLWLQRMQNVEGFELHHHSYDRLHINTKAFFQMICKLFGLDDEKPQVFEVTAYSTTKKGEVKVGL